MTQTISLGARLRAARKAAGFKTSKSFTKKYRIPSSTYSQHESGKRCPDQKMIEYYCEIFSVNLNWLKKGIGQPFKTANIYQSNVISEELLDKELEKKSKYTFHINQKLLTKIISTVIKIHHFNSKCPITKSIQKSIEIYTKIIVENDSVLKQQQSANKILREYKLKNSI